MPTYSNDRTSNAIWGKYVFRPGCILKTDDFIPHEKLGLTILDEEPYPDIDIIFSESGSTLNIDVPPTYEEITITIATTAQTILKIGKDPEAPLVTIPTNAVYTLNTTYSKARYLTVTGASSVVIERRK